MDDFSCGNRGGSDLNYAQRQIGEANFLNSGSIEGSTINIAPAPTTHSLKVQDTFSAFYSIVTGPRLVAAGIVTTSCALLAATANVTTVVAGFGKSQPWATLIATHFPMQWADVALIVGVPIGFFGWFLSSREMLQFGRWSFRNRNNGIEVSRKIAPCPLCNAKMILTTIRNLGDTPWFVCTRNPNHVLEFDYTIKG